MLSLHRVSPFHLFFPEVFHEFRSHFKACHSGPGKV
jgi:hypothetical protein